MAVAQIFRDIRQAKSAQRAMLGLNATLESQVALRTEALEAERRDKAALLDTIIEPRPIFHHRPRGHHHRGQPALLPGLRLPRRRVGGADHRDQLRLPWPRVLARDVAHRGPWEAVARRGVQPRQDGSLYWVDSVIAPHLDAAGRIERIVSFRIDITETKRLQQVASQAWEQAERSEAFPAT